MPLILRFADQDDDELKENVLQVSTIRKPYSTVSTVQNRRKQSNTVQCGTVQYSVVQYSTVVQFRTIKNFSRTKKRRK